MKTPSQKLTLRTIRDAAREVGTLFRVDRVVLFGSYARGTASRDSDVDLLVIARTTRPLDLAGKILWQLGGRFPKDVLVRTPLQIQRALREGDPFVTEILEEGRVLYEARRPRVG